MKYKELFMEYLESPCYKILLEKLRKKEGDNYVKLFDDVGNNFIYYFMTTEPKNESKKNKNELESKSMKQVQIQKKIFLFKILKNLNEEEVETMIY